MRILILSRNPNLYTTRRLLESAAAAGHEAIVTDPMACAIACGAEGSTIFDGAGRRPWDDIDVAIPRVGSAASDHAVAVVRALEGRRVAVVNRSVAIARAKDKLTALQRLASFGVPVPKTVMVRQPSQIPAALRAVAGPPAVVKLPQGTQGVGVMLAESEEALDAILNTIWALGQSAIVQEFVAESRGRDLRVLVVGGKAIAAIRRTARPGEFRANLHRGGSGRVVRLARGYERVAKQAVQALELDVAGVDLLETRTGPRVIEVNSSPGFEGLEKATGLDVARAIVDHAAARARADSSARRAVAGAPAGTFLY